MTPQYILRKSLCRHPHCYRAHVSGEGYVNNGKLSDTDRVYRLKLALQVDESIPLPILADKLDDCDMSDHADWLRSELARLDDYRTQWHRSALSAIENMGYARSYAERGYRHPDKGILFANWNLFPSKACGLLEKYGYEIEWEDEWSTCSDCGNAVRTQPDGYDWTPYYDERGLENGELVCLDCYQEPEPQDTDTSDEQEESVHES